MTDPTPQPDPAVVLTEGEAREAIIESLSWRESLGVGRWGHEVATAVLDDYLVARTADAADRLAAVEGQYDSMRNAVAQGPGCYQPYGWHAMCERMVAVLSPALSTTAPDAGRSEGQAITEEQWTSAWERVAARHAQAQPTPDAGQREVATADGFRAPFNAQSDAEAAAYKAGWADAQADERDRTAPDAGQREAQERAEFSAVVRQSHDAVVARRADRSPEQP